MVWKTIVAVVGAIVCGYLTAGFAKWILSDLLEKMKNRELAKVIEWVLVIIIFCWVAFASYKAISNQNQDIDYRQHYYPEQWEPAL